MTNHTTVVNVRRDAFDVYIGRQNRSFGFPHSVFANPFKAGSYNSREQVIEKYRAWVLERPHLLAQLPDLKGKRLGCWCAPLPYHGDVLVELLEKEAR